MTFSACAPTGIEMQSNVRTLQWHETPGDCNKCHMLTWLSGNTNWMTSDCLHHRQRQLGAFVTVRSHIWSLISGKHFTFTLWVMHCWCKQTIGDIYVATKLLPSLFTKLNSSRFKAITEDSNCHAKIIDLSILPPIVLYWLFLLETFTTKQ